MFAAAEEQFADTV